MTSAEQFNCIFCQDMFDSKEELQIHFRKHGDPKFNQSVKNKTHGDMATSGDRAEDAEVVSCDVCDEVFPTISKAITHKHKMHPDHDAKYFCPWCGKLFTMKHLYNKHIQTTHGSKDQSEDTGFHCDYCEVNFFVPSAVVYHNKFFHRQDTELAAIGHSKKLKMFNQEPLQIYYCPFCGEEYCNKVNLHKHMGDDHIDEDQSPEDVLRCPLCEAVFYHLDAYELHLTYHSTGDQYSEENELIKEITEFSLETVPPMMEKVENESQEDEPSASMGIEELLQQGMNESNDNDTSDEPRKKKKHKKHKKSKKTITLDEFLNMHSDVLGEDLDVQGIVEVPSQVVTKQLRKPQQPRLKPGPKPLPAELAKLKKAGIVIKKKPTPLQGMKVANRMPILNKAQIGSKILPPVKSKPDATTTSGDILSKLLSQSNSQIKIVKKTGEGIPATNMLPDNKESSENKESENIHGTDHVMTDKENGDATDPKEIKINSKNEKITNSVKDDIKQNMEGLTHDISSQESDNQSSAAIRANASQISKENTCISDVPFEEKEDSEEPLSAGNNFKKCAQSSSSEIGKSTAHGAINALRNISQHITIKTLSSPNSVQNPASKENDSDENDPHLDADILDNDKEKNTLKESSPENANKNPLNALKHLSHLTVKSATQPSTTISPTVTKKDVVEKNISNSDIGKKDGQEEYEADMQKVNSSTANDTKDTTKFDALKNLSKHITIKSMSQSPNNSNKLTEKLDPNKSDVDEEFDLDDHWNENNSQVKNKQNINFPNRQHTIKTITNLKNPATKTSSPNHSPKLKQTQSGSEEQNQSKEIVLYNPKDSSTPSSANILKQLPNITAKPLNIAKNITQKVTVQSSVQSTNVLKGNLIQNSMKKVETKQKEEVEIFNVDDSDDEEPGPQNQPNNKCFVNTLKTNETKNSQEKSMAVLKNLSKHITIKPKTLPKDEFFEEHDGMSNDNFHDQDSDFEQEETSTHKALDNQVNSILQNKLKSLGHITMKSRNSSPKNVATSSHSSPKPKNKAQIEEHYDSDPETSSKVKITELPEDFNSDDDIPLQKTKGNIRFNENATDSDNDLDNGNDAHIEDDEDIEAQIKPTRVTKPTPNVNKTPACLNNLKNLTVKSFKENIIDQEDEAVSDDSNEDKSVISNKSKQIAIRPSITSTRQDNNADESQESANRPFKQQIRRAMNQNASTSSNQVNTVNKEVTVQTFQTKTVIQEITTTVTKTIRTVNQSTKQEIQNLGQKTSLTVPVRPQKIQGIRPHQQIKNFQGMSVRPATPTRPRMRNPVPTRPQVGANIRPSNQLVPVRPGIHVARTSTPRMPVIKKGPTPSTSIPNKPVIGKPLKISANAMASATKRIASDEPTGHFSCFKKQKESLIPSESTESEADSAVQYASSSHMSRSNFTSITKTVKGNSVVTATQMKSEVSASSEQLNRLNSMSGLKVVKTSQVKQASKVEERVEVSPAKRNALNAIEKLQKQGLLVKKPRVEEPVVEEPDSDYSNPDADDDYYDDT